MHKTAIKDYVESLGSGVFLPRLISGIKYFAILIITILAFAGNANGQSIGDFGSAGVGPANWSAPGSWVVCVSNGTWAGATPAVIVPTAATNVWILAGNTITMDANPGSCNNLDVAGNLNYTGASAVTLNVSGNLSGAGTLNMSGGAQLHTLNLGGATNSIGTFTTAAVGSTVNYNAGGNQTIFASANYRNLTTSVSGTKSLIGNTIVNNNLVVGAGYFDLGTIANTFTVLGSATLTGIFYFNDQC